MKNEIEELKRDLHNKIEKLDEEARSKLIDTSQRWTLAGEKTALEYSIRRLEIILEKFQ